MFTVKTSNTTNYADDSESTISRRKAIIIAIGAVVFISFVVVLVLLLIPSGSKKVESFSQNVPSQGLSKTLHTKSSVKAASLLFGYPKLTVYIVSASLAAFFILAIVGVVLSVVLTGASNDTIVNSRAEEQTIEETNDWKMPAVIAGVVLLVVVVLVLVLCCACKAGSEAPITVVTDPVPENPPAGKEPEITDKDAEHEAVPEITSEDAEHGALLSELSKKDPSQLTDNEKVFLRLNEIYSKITKDLPEKMLREKPLPKNFTNDYSLIKVFTYSSYPKLKVYHALLVAIFLKGPYKTVEECETPRLVFAGKSVQLKVPLIDLVGASFIVYRKDSSMDVLDVLDALHQLLNSDEPIKTIKDIYEYLETWSSRQ